MTRHCAVANSPGVGDRVNGVVLLALLLTLALGAIGLMAAVDVWSLSRQREHEQQLLFAGDQYRRAIQRYYATAPPATPHVLPASLEDLLEDKRFPVPVRHLRRLYSDPITGGTEWGALRVGDRIAAVYSLSDKTPVKQDGFAPPYEQFRGKTAYREWVFGIASSPRSAVGKPPPPDVPASAPSAPR